MWSSVTLPSGSKSRSRSGSSARASAAGVLPPRPPAIATSARKSRRVTSITAPSMADARDAEALPLVEGGQVELELGVLHGVGRQHVGPERRHAPLHPLAQIPDVGLAG